MIALQDHSAFFRRDLEKNITRKKRLLEPHRFPAILVNRLVTK
jgi:hypothetical protein